MGSIRTIAGKSVTGGIILAALLLVLGTTDSGYAHTGPDECGLLGGVIDIPSGECQISASPNIKSSSAHGGSFDLDETLRILNGGRITVPVASGGNTLTINITGQFIMEVGAKIVGDVTGTGTASGVGANITINATENILLAGNGGATSAMITATQTAGSCTAGGKGGKITLTSSGGNITTEFGTVISVNGTPCPAGDILITALPKGKIDIDGQVLSVSTQSGTGRPGGGTITIKAGCDLEISDTGVVSSRGRDPGGDLVHLEGCVVLIHGLVESTGAGHAVPNNPANHCNLDAAAHPIGTGPSTGFTGCVEVWSGTTITIDNTSGNSGEVNADIGGPGGSQGRGWIDLFARGDINIIGGDPPDYVVHANGGLFQNTDDGGLVTIKSAGGKVITIGSAIRANSTSSGGKGGDVRIEANSDVDFTTASVQAMGNSTAGDARAGGHITAKSYNGFVLGTAPGELNASGGRTGVPASFGSVILQGCGTLAILGDGVAYTGIVQSDNDAGAELPTILLDDCGGSPTIPDGVPLGTCTILCTGGGNGDCQKAAVKSVLNPLTGRFPNNAGPDKVIKVHAPFNELIQPFITGASDTNLDGYILLLVVAHDGGLLGGSTTQSVEISLPYEKPFALIACSVTLKDPTPGDGNPTGQIFTTAGSPANIFVMDLHGSESGVAGWKVEGDGRYMRNVANSKNGTGIWFVGNGNTMHNGNAVDNTGVGVLVHGNDNAVESTDSFANGSHGIQVIGNGNTVDDTDVGDRGKGNGGDGINVNGDGNKILENDVFANSANGIVVIGSSNAINKNDVGDGGKGNLGDGINVNGSGNTLLENRAYANTGDGLDVSGGANTLKKNKSGDRGDKANGLAGFLLGGGSSLVENTAIGNLGDGFHLTTSGFSLSKNVSGGSGSGYPNGGCQYQFDVLGNTNAGGNKTNNAPLSGTLLGCK